MSVYHHGEISVQRRAGVRAFAAHVEAVIGQAMPAAAREFVSEQPMIVLGVSDSAGRIPAVPPAAAKDGPVGRRWAGAIVGEPGFMRAIDGRRLIVNARPPEADPLATLLASPTLVGGIILDPVNRRRMRINGTSYPTDIGLRIDADQVYGNCPRYIQRREYSFVDSAGVGEAPTAARATALAPAQRRLIEQASTFFITTADDQGNGDTSHRGGNPGFVHIVSATRLRWPDYAGNSMFNTLGNLAVNPAAGLLLLDWSTGSTLQLSGLARVIWDEEEFAQMPGAERLVEFDIHEVVETTGVSRLRWSDPEFSRFNP